MVVVDTGGCSSGVDRIVAGIRYRSGPVRGDKGWLGSALFSILVPVQVNHQMGNQNETALCSGVEWHRAPHVGAGAHWHSMLYVGFHEGHWHRVLFDPH